MQPASPFVPAPSLLTRNAALQSRVFLSGVLITHQLDEDGLRWFSAASSVVDELVAFVDETRAAPDLHEKLAQLNARVFNTRAPEFYRADFREMVTRCRGDWILKIDYDEELSLEWHDSRWRDVVAGSEFTHFWCPRRWLTTSHTYIACEPWWPDWQLRLFRNLPEEITFPTRLHDTMRMNGPAGYLRTLAIHHHDLALGSRAVREEKAAKYEQQRPGNGLGFFYLYEDYQPPEATIPERSHFDPSTELLRMQPIDAVSAASIAIDPDEPPARIRSGEMIWLDVRVQNGSENAIRSGAPFPINLAYHWIESATYGIVVFDGERTALMPEISPGMGEEFRMFIVAPVKPGKHLLRITMVQERIRWFDDAQSPTTRDFAVEIVE